MNKLNGLCPDQMQILLDIHTILMTWNTDEHIILQKLCEKIAASLPVSLSWGGLIGSDNKLTLSGTAGEGAEGIKGLELDYSRAMNLQSIRQCFDELLPVSLPCSLVDWNVSLIEHLPSDMSAAQIDLYPLSLKRRCVGVLAVISPNQQNARYHTLMQLIAQYAGFALGMLRSFVEREHIQNNMRLAAAVFDHSLEGIFITDTDGCILAANAAVTRITGYSSEELMGQNPRVLKSGRHDQGFYAALWESVHQTNQWEGEIWNKRKNGEIFPEWLSISAVHNERSRVVNYICIFIDISKQKDAESRLNFLAYHDKLTGLPNRDLFNDRLNASILRAKRNKTQIAVLFIDVDHFKYVNDTFGHDMGDLLLQKTALKIKSCLRESDTVARMGGDEFTVILDEVTGQEDVELTARRILAVFEKPVLLEGKEFYMSVSIGVSFYPEDASNPSVLMKHADTAMYSAKNSGRKCLHFFQSNMEKYSVHHIEIGQQLRHALDHEEFCLYYQPQIDLVSGHIVGAEALIRWRHPQKGLVMPCDFIPLAEETGMIVPIGEWVLNRALNDCRLWHMKGHGLRVAVNLSARQFNQPGLTESIAEALTQVGMAPHFLELELTESLAMRQVDETLLSLNTLKRAGVQLTIDDFGTGYSSLSYLKLFPINRLKIDQSFIHDIASDPNDAAIVVSIIAMAHCMGLEVLAEGVETEDQRSFLKMHGCDEVQGYLTGRPVAVDEFMALL